MAATDSDNKLRFELKIQSRQEDKFFVTDVQGSEAISEPYWLKIIFASNNSNLQADELLLQSVMLKIFTSDADQYTQYSGLIFEFSMIKRLNDYVLYQIEFRPKLWKLSFNRITDIYCEEKTITEIRSSFKVEAPKTLDNPKKIYIYEKYLFIVDEFKGFQIVDNSDVNSPTPLHFIHLDGCTDVSVNNGIIYANQGPDIVSLSIDNAANIQLTGRVQDVMNTALKIGANFIYDYEKVEVTEEVPCGSSSIRSGRNDFFTRFFFYFQEFKTHKPTQDLSTSSWFRINEFLQISRCS